MYDADGTSDSGRKPTEQEREQAKRWAKRIKYFAGPHKERCERWKRNREYVNGTQHEDNEAGLVRVNLAASTINTIQPNIYAKAPEVAVTPEERVKQSDYADEVVDGSLDDQPMMLPAQMPQQMPPQMLGAPQQMPGMGMDMMPPQMPGMGQMPPGMPGMGGEMPEVPQVPPVTHDPAMVKEFAATLQVVLNRYAVRATNLKARGKEAVRSSLTCTTGWVKVIFQRDRKTDPLVKQRIEDAQDNIARLESLKKETEDEGECANYEAKLADIKQLKAGLEKKLEITVSEGLVIDVVQPEHLLILDNSISTIDEYPSASALAHKVYMTASAFKTRFGYKPPKKATRYASADNEKKHSDTDQSDPDDEIVCVHEIWSKDELTIYTLAEGAEEYCCDPEQPETLGQQWYGFFPLQLWRVNSMLYARTLVDNLIELCDEYNTRRTAAVSHRDQNTPVRLLNASSGITKAEIDAINKRDHTTRVIAISADPNQPLQNQIGQLDPILYDPAMYDTSDILRDIEMVSGAQDAYRGGIATAKTATEAEIMAMGMQSRTSEQLDAIEDWLSSILSYCAQLLLLNVPAERIKEQFGESAVWPQLTRKELFEQVQVQIRAGSTSKPNKMRERDQWLQFLPQMQEAVMKIAELRMAGQEDMAQSLLKLLNETMRRFDERLSAEEFLPNDEGENGSAAMMKTVQAKVQEMIAQAEEALNQQKQELEQRTRDIEQRETKLQVDEIEFKAAQDVSQVKATYEEMERKLHEERVQEQIELLISKAETDNEARAVAERQEMERMTMDQQREQDEQAKEAEKPAEPAVDIAALLEGQLAMQEQMTKALAALAAPRRTKIVRGPDGKPTESISTVETNGVSNV